MNKVTHAYIGIDRTGKVVAVSVETHDRAKALGAELAEFIESGLVVARVTLEVARREFGQQRTGLITDVQRDLSFQP